MNQKEWYLKILGWAEKDDRLKISEMQAVVLAEHLENEASVTNTVDKHYLVFDRPHIYKCKCGMVRMIYISEFKVEEKTLEQPKNVEYMPCGHATCARLENGECIICKNAG